MKNFICMLVFVSILAISNANADNPVDKVNCMSGHISHMLVPTYPTVHLPSSALRFYPNRDGAEKQVIKNFPLSYPAHRNKGVFRFSPFSNNATQAPINYYFDNEKVMPYKYQVFLDDHATNMFFTPTANGGIFKLKFENNAKNGFFLNANNGELSIDKNGAITGFDIFGKRNETKQQYPVKVFIYMTANKNLVSDVVKASTGSSIKLTLAKDENEVEISFALSYISQEQAKTNFDKQLANKNFKDVEKLAKRTWNKTLGQIKIEGGTPEQQKMFYTSLYRCYERMVNFTEDNKYYSGYDNKIHTENSFTYYTDDWAWDTYRNLHPLMTILRPSMQLDRVRSYIAMGEQAGVMPTFPQIYGDMHAMNGNHYASIIWDSYCKNITDFDLKKAYQLCKKTILEMTMIPWLKMPKTQLDDFYHKNGFFPALKDGEEEPLKFISKFEKRQAVTVTLAQSYDDWCMAQMAKTLGLEDDYNFFIKRAFNYRNLFNKRTGFFAPKNDKGEWIEPFDTKLGGSIGARAYFAENNAWTYIWDVSHNHQDLINLFGSKQAYEKRLDQLFVESLGIIRWKWNAVMPDSTGMVGQFVMGNEPSLHIPYLYNYIGKPWKTQKLIRRLIDLWFRTDYMGMPGDEDGGSMSSFYVFSAMGFYPVTPGLPMYVIGSPVFKEVEINLENGKEFKIKANNYSNKNKYIQSARLNGKSFNRTWIKHSEIMQGGTLEFDMGLRPNKKWGTSAESIPPSFQMKN